MRIKLTKLFQLTVVTLLLTTYSCSNNEDFTENQDLSIESLNSKEVYDNSNTLQARQATIGVAPCTKSGENYVAGTTIYKYTNVPNWHRQFRGETDVIGTHSANGVPAFKTREIDDRTCAYNYQQETISGTVFGKYRISKDSNPYESTLQPRIERATPKTKSNSNGKYVEVEGRVIIRSLAPDSNRSRYWLGHMNNDGGTYIIQAKGTHSNRDIGSVDPAICLVIAKKNSSGNITLFREEIKKRGGSGESGRRTVKLTENIRFGVPFSLKMRNGFRSNGTQFVDITINGAKYSWTVPKSYAANGRLQVGQNAKIRFGAYRCKNGKAEVLWGNFRQILNL